MTETPRTPGQEPSFDSEWFHSIVGSIFGIAVPKVPEQGQRRPKGQRHDSITK